MELNSAWAGQNVTRINRGGRTLCTVLYMEGTKAKRATPVFIPMVKCLDKRE
jgi:hypothetical protein